MTKTGPNAKEVMAALQATGIKVRMHREPKYKYWVCAINRKEKYVSAAGTSPLSALWATIIQLIKIK